MRKFLLPYTLRRDNRESALEYRRLLEQSQYWPRQKMLDYQWEKLKKLLQYSYENCPYYKDVFDERGLTPLSLRALDDLALLPVLSRDIIFDQGERIISRTVPKKSLQEFTSGGTTGQQVIMYRDQESYNIKLALEWRNESWMGKDIGDKTMYFWPAHIDFVDDATIKMKLKNRFILRIKAVDVGPADPALLKELYREMIKFRPRFLKVFPAPFFGFAEFVEENRLKVPKIAGIMSTGEILYEDQRRKFEQVFDCPVFDMYGSRETGNNACECSAHEGLHISPESAILEFVNDGKRVAYGQEGEILITDLTNYGMPLIRYQINDYGIPLRTSCSCGRELPLMSSAMGRIQDYIWSPDGTRYNGLALGIQSADFSLLATAREGIEIGQIQFIQKSLTHFHVRIRNKPEPTNKTFEYITRQVRRVLGDGVRVTFDVVEEIPREKSGKTRYVICEIDPPVGSGGRGA